MKRASCDRARGQRAVWDYDVGFGDGCPTKPRRRDLSRNRHPRMLGMQIGDRRVGAGLSPWAYLSLRSLLRRCGRPSRRSVLLRAVWPLDRRRPTATALLPLMCASPQPVPAASVCRVRYALHAFASGRADLFWPLPNATVAEGEGGFSMTLRADPLSFLSRDALEALEELIDRRVAEALATRESAASSAPSSPYMTVAEAANYLRCRRRRLAVPAPTQPVQGRVSHASEPRRSGEVRAGWTGLRGRQACLTADSPQPLALLLPPTSQSA